MESRDELIDAMAAYVRAYRLTGGEPSAMQRSALAAFEGAAPSDYGRALLRANAADRRHAE